MRRPDTAALAERSITLNELSALFFCPAKAVATGMVTRDQRVTRDLGSEMPQPGSTRPDQ